MSLLTQVIESFKSQSLKGILHKMLQAQDCHFEQDKWLGEAGGKADLYIEGDDVIYLVKTIETYQVQALCAEVVEEVAKARKHLLTRTYKRVVPVLIIGQYAQSRAFLEAGYKNQALIVHGPIEECADQLEFILQHQVIPTYHLSVSSRDSEGQFFRI
ncbi:hypothetical protein CIG75_14165 [Tumebacillus algifaecis]|uniref:Restriction endonuclease type IV Mrr domain-containing protein n=1 Tax=Tumebacillus algifaecis TaxID=1214604 RepID=A0A223D3Q8_9BACL|nr:hypothetical protein [Tumebacillus algifaecis]ASS75994.1 hypothetical protein CIG75_14165 [Tumebacillus algifaecis]